MGLPWYIEAALGVPGAIGYVWLVFASARLERWLGVYSVPLTSAVVFGAPAAAFYFAPWAAAVATALGGGFLALLLYLYSRPHR